MKKSLFEFQVNGQKCEGAAYPNQTLATFLREELGLTGTKVGCDMGTCGCCTVLINGKPRLSCLTLALECQGAEIETIEGLNQGEIHPLQRAFAECGGSQCGFCTPGFIMSAKHLLACNPDPSRDEIKEAVAGNLCRCTGFVKIYDAIEKAGAELRGEKSEKVDLHAFSLSSSS